MSKLLRVLGVSTILMSVLIAVNPEPLLSAVDWASRPVRYMGAVWNLGWGLLLLKAAPAFRFPAALRAWGAFSIVSALAIPLLPNDFWVGYVRWWTVEGVTLYRILASPLGILFGAFLVYGAQPKRAAA